METQPPRSGPDLPAPAFSYSSVPATHRVWLRHAAEQSRALAYRTAVDMIAVGRLLAEARGRLKRRTFKTWLAAELPWSRMHAYRLIAVAETFGPLVSHAVTERIDPTALYLLARPEVPPQAREYAVELAGGRRVTAADAREILDAHRRAPDPTRAEVRAHEDRMRPVRAAEAAGRRAAPRDPDPAPALAAWAAFEALARRSRVVHVSTIDEDGGEDEPLFSVTVYADDAGPRNAVRRSLGDAVLAAAGGEREKVCPGCDETKPLSLFGDNADLADGRSRYCKTCERKRLGALKRRKKAARKKGP